MGKIGGMDMDGIGGMDLDGIGRTWTWMGLRGGWIWMGMGMDWRSGMGMGLKKLDCRSTMYIFFT